jgi:signal transduction histidine kinase
VSRSAEALWRAIAVFRFASLGYATLLLGVFDAGRYSRPDLAWVVLSAMLSWTIVTTLAYSHRRNRTAMLLSADLAVTAGLLLSTFALQLPAARHSGLVPVTGPWVAGPVLAWAVRYGRIAGAAAALVLSLPTFALSGWSITVVPNGEVLMLLAGIAVGHVAQLAAALEAERQHADRVEAAGRERERLARDIHDSVLQVLALVHKRGLEAGGKAAELGRLAGEQEAALRALIGAGLAAANVDVDLNGLLKPLASESVTVGGPAGPVLVGNTEGEGITAAVRAALDNVRRHCGAHTRAWVLVEDEPEVMTVTIRDDGPGIAEGRLAQAAASGRLGVSQSIHGRMHDLGGSADIRSLPGEGTEVTLRLPRVPPPRRPAREPARARAW